MESSYDRPSKLLGFFRSTVNQSLITFRVSFALHRNLRSGVVNRAEIIRSQFYLNSFQVLFQAVPLRSARNRRDPRLLGQHPRQRDCAGVAAFARRAVQQIHDDLFAWRASAVKRGTTLRKSVLSNVVFSSIFPVRKPLPSGLKEQTDASSSSVGKISASGLPPQRVFALEAVMG